MDRTWRHEGGPVFEDPQVIIGAVIGLLIITGGTLAAVSAHRRRERAEQDSAGR
jgi:hypothetical protein